jgi:hypothetical protein
MSSIPVNILTDYLIYLTRKVEEGSLINYPTLNLYSVGGIDGGTIIASFKLPTPAFARPNEKLETYLLIPSNQSLSTIAINNGTVKEYAILNKNQQPVFYGAVGGPGTKGTKVGKLTVDIEMSSIIVKKETPLSITNYIIKLPL